LKRVKHPGGEDYRSQQQKNPARGLKRDIRVLGHIV